MSLRRLRPCLLGALVACLTAQAAQGRPIHATASATVGRRPVGQALAPGFVGLSFEYQALHAYTGSDAEWVNPLLVQLLRNLAPGHQRPVLRVGGDSTDTTWRPAPGLSRPGGVTYTITDDWLDTTRALARLLDARLILGVNLAANDPQLAATEAAAFMHAIGRPYIEGLEIGNEPDLYPRTSGTAAGAARASAPDRAPTTSRTTSGSSGAGLERWSSTRWPAPPSRVPGSTTSAPSRPRRRGSASSPPTGFP